MGTWPPERDVPAELRGPVRGLGPGVIVVGVDRCESAMRALAWALGLARRSGGTIVGVHVSRCTTTADLASLAVAFGIAPVENHLAGSPEDRHLETLLADVARESELSARLECVAGDPVDEIIRAAHRHRADLIVIGGARSRRASRRSIATRLVRDARCPLTVVP